MQVNNLQSPTKQAKFKIGDFVTNLTGSRLGKVIDLFYYPIEDCWVYCVNNNATMYNESHLQLIDYPENGTITEAATKTGTEQQFTVGEMYEFFNGITWHKGEFVTAVDGKTRRYFLGILHNCTSEGMFEDIRPIQPVKIERWINISKSGNQVGKKCFASKMEACQHAPQSQNVFQVKLEGTYTI